jgi:hypothetical protein
VNALKAEKEEKPVMVIMASEFRLPEILRHIEAGKTIIVIPATETTE